MAAWADTFNEVVAPYVQEQFADVLDYDSYLDDSAGRFFVNYNSSNTVSTAYALFIVLAISGVLAGVAGIAYIALLGGGFTGRSLDSARAFHKRSVDEEESLAKDQLIRVMILIAEMEEVIRRSGLRKEGEECKLLEVCELVSGQVEGQKLTAGYGVEHFDLGRRIVRLMDNGRNILEQDMLTSRRAASLDDDNTLGQLQSYLRASDLGLHGGNICERKHQELCNKL